MTYGIIAEAVLPTDPIQHCLDVRRLADLSAKQKMAAKEPGILRFKFHKISPQELPLNTAQITMNEVITALNNQIENCQNSRGEVQVITIAGRQLKRQQWCLEANKKMLELAKAAQGDVQKYLLSLKTTFDWYKSEGWPENYAGFKRGDVQFTAYYAPAAVEARSKRAGDFVYPIYSNPGVVNVNSECKKFNLKPPLCGIDPISKMVRGFCLKKADGSYTLAPDREEIGRGALDSKYVLAFLKNPDDPAFLMLQGSGSLMIDGKLFHINYDGTNGRPRTMLGRIVQCAQDPSCGGNLDTMERCAKDPKCHDEAKLRCNVSKEVRQSAGSERLIRQYLQSLGSEEKANALRNRDQSYVFFVKEDGGPYGTENISLTPHVSCATDHRVIPVGMSFIYNYRGTTSWCIAQDTGGAIVGAHIDLYKGEGEQAGREANAVNHGGALYLALPKRGSA